ATNSNEDENLDVTLKKMQKMVAAKMNPEMEDWIKKNCPTTSEGKQRTPPLPIEELYNVPEMPIP
ncbi:hypothetical protein PFISCL1PPCAC_16703, partial [Pristionchus fissidentatus]